MLKRLKKILDLENQTALDLPNNSCYMRKEQYSHTHTHTIYLNTFNHIKYTLKTHEYCEIS